MCHAIAGSADLACFYPARVSAVPAGKASVQNMDYTATPSKVVIGTNVNLFTGTATVHAKHPLKYKTAFHQYAEFFDVGGEEDATLGEGLPRFADKMNQFDFVGEAKPHY